MLREALVEFEKVPNRCYACRGYAHARLGDRTRALQTVAELDARSKKESVSPFPFATIYLGLGDRDRVFAWLEKTYADRDLIALSSMRLDPIWDPIRSDPRFADLMRRIGPAQ